MEDVRGQRVEDRDPVTRDRHDFVTVTPQVTPDPEHLKADPAPEDNPDDAHDWPSREDVQRYKSTTAWFAFISDCKKLPVDERPSFEAWHRERDGDRPLPKTLRASAR